MTAAIDNHHSQDLEPKKLAAFVRRWWMVIVSIATGFGAIYSTIDKVDALEHRISRSEETAEVRFSRIERMMMATYVNARLACVQSKAPGCVTFDRIEEGDIPDLETPTLKKGK